MTPAPVREWRHLRSIRVLWSRPRSWAWLTALVLVFGVSSRPSGAQGATVMALDGRVSSSLRTQLVAFIDSATARGLPSAPLVDKALEGASKGADDRHILVAVHAVAAALRTAQSVLGNASGVELATAAATLRAGVSPQVLVELRRALPGRSLVVPLSVLGSLVVQGTSPGRAVTAVVAYAKQNDDSHILAFGRDVAREIASGIAPDAALVLTTSGTGATAGIPQPAVFDIPGGGKTSGLPGKKHGQSLPNP